MNYNERTVQVSPDFVKEALYDHYDLVKERRGGEIYDEFIDDFIDLVAECWTTYTAWYLIDNRLINGEHYTFEEIYDQEFKNYYEKDREELEEEEKEKVLEEIHEYCDNQCYYYSDDLEEIISY